MGFYDDAGWLAVSTFNAANGWATQHDKKKSAAKVEEIIRQMTDPVLEEKVRFRVCGVSPEEYQKLWEELEVFKRDNLHLVTQHLSTSYWGHVGSWRFPITHEQLCTFLGKKKLTRSEEGMLTQFRGWTVTLLMNMYGKYSKMEATRIAFQKVYGAGHGAWTMQFG